VLSDHEQRALEELERWYAIDAQEPARSHRRLWRRARRSNRPPGSLTVAMLAVVSVGLLVTGVAAAGFSIALATATGWVFWRLCAHRRGDGTMPTPPAGGPVSISRYLRWLAQPADDPAVPRAS